MKEMIYKDIRGENPLKHEVSIEERNNHATNLFVKKRTAKYFITGRFSSKDTDKIKNWIKNEKEKGYRKSLHIYRRFDSNTGENKLICKLIGEVFVVHDFTVFKVVYVNYVKVQILKT